MTERERLIEILRKQIYPKIGADPTDIVADYLLDNGVRLPPCKVGDKLYAISDTRIIECTCYDMNIGNKVMICASFKCDYDCEGCPFNNWVKENTGEYSCSGEYGDCFFEEDDFGKTVFLTREEAEKTLVANVIEKTLAERSVKQNEPD